MSCGSSESSASQYRRPVLADVFRVLRHSRKSRARGPFCDICDTVERAQLEDLSPLSPRSRKSRARASFGSFGSQYKQRSEILAVGIRATAPRVCDNKQMTERLSVPHYRGSPLDPLRAGPARTLTFRISEKHYEQITELRRAARVTQSDILRTALEQYLDTDPEDRYEPKAQKTGPTPRIAAA